MIAHGTMTELMNHLELPADASVIETAQERLRPQRRPAEHSDVRLDTALIAAINQLETRVMSDATGAGVAR